MQDSTKIHIGEAMCLLTSLTESCVKGDLWENGWLEGIYRTEKSTLRRERIHERYTLALPAQLGFCYIEESLSRQLLAVFRMLVRGPFNSFNLLSFLKFSDILTY